MWLDFYIKSTLEVKDANADQRSRLLYACSFTAS